MGYAGRPASTISSRKHSPAPARGGDPSCRLTHGRRADGPRRPDWERVKADVMLAALRAKFAQHPTLRSLLLGTGDALIVEHLA